MEEQEDMGWAVTEVVVVEAAVLRCGWWLLESLSHAGAVYWETIRLCPWQRFPSVEHVAWCHLPAGKGSSGAGAGAMRSGFCRCSESLGALQGEGG